MASPQKDRIRESWQPRRLYGLPARAWLILRRATATLIALGMVGFCVYLLFGLLWNSKTYFVYLTAGSYQPLGGQPVRFAYRDAEAFKALAPAFAHYDIADAAASPLTRRFLEEKLTSMAGLGMGSDDVLIVCLTAHGVVNNDEAFLLCEQKDEDSAAELIPLAEVLEGLKQAQAGTKLLILDASREADIADTGLAGNDFPRFLEQAVRDAQDPSLWVLSANRSLERSHISPALHRSVLGYVLAQGLGGLADRNQDAFVQLDELFEFVQSGVSAWVDQATTHKESQTPSLLNFETGRAVGPAPILISTKNLPTATAPNIRQAAEDASAEVARSTVADGVKSLVPEQVAGIAADQLAGAAATTGGESAANAEDKLDAEPPAVGSGGTGPLEAGLNFAGLAQKELARAWEATAKLNAGPGRTAPSVYAPAQWRELLNSLLWYEQFCSADVPPNQERTWRPVVNEMQNLNRSFDGFAKNTPTNSPGGNVVERIKALSPQIPWKGGSAQISSLALAEQIAAVDPGRTLPEGMKEFLAAYDALLAQDNSTAAELNALLDKGADKLGLNIFYEFQLLVLRLDPDVPWPLTRQVLQTRRQGEQAAADRLCGDGWAQDTIDAADRLRWEGERLVIDRTDTAWADLAEIRLSAAQNKYQQAASELARVRQLSQERNQILERLPQYVRWEHLSQTDDPNAPQTVALRNLLALFASVGEALAKPNDEKIGGFEYLYGQLRDASQTLDQSLDPSGNPWRIGNLLDTTLPAAASRATLQQDWTETETELMSTFTFSKLEPATPAEMALTEQQWNRLRDQLDLELALARLAGFDAEKINQLESLLEAADDQRWDQLDKARQLLQELYAAPPEFVESIAGLSDLRDPATRPAQLAQLRELNCQWLLLGTHKQSQLDLSKTNLAAALDEASWYDLLRWHSTRLNRAAADAPLREIAYLDSSERNYRELANEIPNQPPVEPAAPPQLSIESPSEIALVTSDEAEVNVTVRSLAATEMPLWLVAQYDPNLLKIESTEFSSYHVLREKSTPANPEGVSADTAEYPLRPDRLAVELTDRLPAGGAKDFRLRVNRLSNARGTTKLILKAISGETYVRRELQVELPGRELLQLVVDDGPEFWSSTGDGVDLHPVPNHAREFAFSVVNAAKVEKKLEVSFWIPGAAPRGGSYAGLPTGALRAETANRLLDSFKPLDPLGPPTSLILPASGEPVRVQFTTPAQPDQKVDPLANLLVADPAAADKVPGIPLRHGLLVVMKDQQNGELTLRRVEIAPQRPPRYLQATAQYDPTTDRVRIDLEATSRNVVPAEGIRIAGEIVEGVSAQRESRLKADLKAPDYAANLFAHVPANAPQEITALVHVDDYPRAFIFKIPRGVTSTGIEPVSDAMQVRIVTPEQGTAYQAPLDKVPALVQVDAPEGSFADASGRSFVEIGIDENLDHELQNESSLVLNSDRQMAVVAKRLAPDGTLTLDTRVSDFRLDVPSTGLSELAAELLGHVVVTGLGESWSEPVKVLLDGAGPSIAAELRPGREIGAGSELEIRVFTDVPDLSGVQQVEAVFESAATADAEKTPWERAKPDGSAGWIVKLPTDKLGLGPHTALIRATDKVGNRSEVLREDLRIVAKGPDDKASTPDKKEPQLPNTVAGRVFYGDRPVVGATVALEAIGVAAISPVTSNEEGRFTILKVPPGKYAVKARGLVNNGFRQAQMEVTVPALPKKPEPLTVKLQ